jgi:hypothetical protein
MRDRGGEGGEGDVNTARFKPDKGFSGADYGKGGEGGAVQVRRGASGAGASLLCCGFRLPLAWL